VRDHIFGTTRSIFTRFFVHVSHGRGSVPLLQLTDTFRISGFMDDVIFAHKPRLLDVAAQLWRSSHEAASLAINGTGLLFSQSD